MKLKKLLAAFVFAVLGVMLIGSIETQAKSDMITLTPSTKKDCHRYCYIYISVATSEDNIKELEYQYGKVKKTANKYWKDTEKPYYYEEDGNTVATIYADTNGYYSVRVTLKNGKKYVKSIKIKNMKPCSFNSSIPAKIKEFLLYLLVSFSSFSYSLLMMSSCIEIRFDSFFAFSISA